QRFGAGVDRRRSSRLQPEWVQPPDRRLNGRRLQRQLDDGDNLLRRRNIEARLDALLRPIHEPEALDDLLRTTQIESSTHVLPFRYALPGNGVRIKFTPRVGGRELLRGGPERCRSRDRRRRRS